MVNPDNKIKKESLNFVKILRQHLPTLNINYLRMNINKCLFVQFNDLHFQSLV